MSTQSKSNLAKFPPELLIVSIAGAAIGGYYSYRGSDISKKAVPEIGDLLPWWLITALVAVAALVTLLGIVVRFSEDPEDRKAFKLVSGILQPLLGMFAGSLALGTAFAWGARALIVGADDGPARALLYGTIALAVVGIILLVAAKSGWGKPWLVRWRRRLNPRL